MRYTLAILCVALPTAVVGQTPKTTVAKPILATGQTLTDVSQYVAAKIPNLPTVKGKKEWEAYAVKLRQDVLDRVVYRGEAAKWRDAKTLVEWADAEPGGEGYRIKKLRFEALPGLWIPALLYEPTQLEGKVPATLNVMGHERGGKDVAYQQIRCINLAKRGMLALNVEWFAFGQLKGDSYSHGRMNQLDLCGTSGLAPFYLALKRGLDILLDHPHADPQRVAVSGLSGGGWQTIYISALDTRVTLTNPVAGYSSFHTRIKHHKDLGDSEQTPCDMAVYADYNHFTALLAPRAALLTFNSKDDCCFESGYALPPLLEAAGPSFRLYDKAKSLRPHVNDVPGTHNFDKDNRQAFYRMIGDHFFPDDKNYPRDELPVGDEVKPAQTLRVKMPEKNHDFNSLALDLAKKLPRPAALPDNPKFVPLWQEPRRRLLRDVVRFHDGKMEAKKIREEDKDGCKVTYWQLALDKAWQVPVVEIVKGQPTSTTVYVHDDGWRTGWDEMIKLAEKNERVIGVDVYDVGECHLGGGRGYLFSLLLGTVGERPLGIQASQLAAVAAWAGEGKELALLARGNKTALAALATGAISPKTYKQVDLHGSLASLKEVIERNMSYEQAPSFFCFGLLEHFDIWHIAALAAPQPVRFHGATERHRQELRPLADIYLKLGKNFDPAK